MSQRLHWHRSWVLAGLVFTAPPSLAAAQGLKELTVAHYAESTLDLFAIGTDDSVVHFWKREPTGAWGGREELGGVARDIAAVELEDGRFEVFVIGADAAVWHNWQPAGGVSWSGWESLGGDAQRLAVARSDTGRYGLFVVGSDGAIWQRGRDGAEAEFEDWQRLGGTALQLSAAGAVGGGFVVAVAGDDTAIAYTTLTDSGEPIETDADAAALWQSAYGMANDLALARRAGRVELFVVGSDGFVWEQSLVEAGGADWQELGIPARRVAAGGLGPGLELFVLGADEVVSSASRPSLSVDWEAPQVVAEASPLASQFSGTAVLAIPSLDVNQDSPVMIGLRFGVDRRRFAVTSFAPIVTERFDTPFGSNVSTISLNSSGQGEFDPDTGALRIPVSLHFDQSLDIPLVQEDADLALDLSSAGPGGSNLDRDSQRIALGSSGKFSANGSSPLDGADCNVVLIGTLSALP